MLARLKPFYMGRVVLIDPNFDNTYHPKKQTHVGHIVGFCRGPRTSGDDIEIQVQTAYGEVRSVPPDFLII